MTKKRVARELTRLVNRFDDEYRAQGLRTAISESIETVRGYAEFPLHGTNRQPESFSAFGRQFRYFRHPYNRAWRNERSVELALAFEFFAGWRGRLLELGNVTPHYGAPPHDVLDKYEVSPGVINEDIATFRAEPYDSILSISTLEHVGWDERPREPDKILRAYENLLTLLKPDGRMLITCPIGHNPCLDALIFDCCLDLQCFSFLKRVSRYNIWVEATKDDVRDARYGSPFRNANAIFVGICGSFPPQRSAG